ncbi:flippase [Bacillaceae bacterium Marseille-Q3522]|nr:flippase [Bacillaceae bacterium Marseille-Q3522]
MTAKKLLLENFLSLTILQGINYILPLITLPYLVRVLSPEGFGMVSFAQSLTQFFIIVTDYGFNLSATKQISLHQKNRGELQSIFSSVLSIKIILMCLSFITLCILVLAIPKFSNHSLIYILTFGLVIGNVLFPIWFFQGMESMKYITILNIVAKGIATICIFVFVHNNDDILLVPTLNSLGFVFTGVLSIWFVNRKFSIYFEIPSLKEVKYQLHEGWHIFISTAAINLYTASNTFILGLFTNNTVVGYYASAEKLINAATGLINPISQTIYPHMNKLAIKSKENGMVFIRKIVKLVGAFTFSISIIIFFLAEFLVNLVLGDQYENSVIIVKILSLLPFLIGLSNIFGIQTMLTFGYKKAFSKVLIMTSLLNIVIAFCMVPFLNHIGTAIGVLTSEIFVTVTMFLYLKNKGINIIGGKNV